MSIDQTDAIGGVIMLLLLAVPGFIVGFAGGVARRMGAAVLITVLIYAVGAILYWRSQQFTTGTNGYQLLVDVVAAWFILLSQIIALPSLALGYSAARFLSGRFG